MMGIGYSTAMVGDGANDCQSLKTAEVREGRGGRKGEGGKGRERRVE